jgi:hypothetical protein
MRQHRFCLIVSRVRYRDPIQISGVRGGSKKFITHPPRRIFEIPTPAIRFAGNIAAIGYKFELKFRRQHFRELLVFVGLHPAKLMVEVKNQELDSKFRAQCREQVEQRHGICSTGNTHPNAISRPNHRMAVDRFKHALLKLDGHWIVRIPLDSAPDSLLFSLLYGSKPRDETHNLACGSASTACRSR